MAKVVSRRKVVSRWINPAVGYGLLPVRMRLREAEGTYSTHIEVKPKRGRIYDVCPKYGLTYQEALMDYEERFTWLAGHERKV